MKKYILIAFTLFLFIFAYGQDKKLVILHTNDLHSQLDTYGSNAGKYSANNGGMVRIATYIKQVKSIENNVIVLDAGDFSQGSPYYNLFSGQAEIDMMNVIGYDAGTLGNHEFDLGMDNLKTIIEKANFPIVNANYVLQDTPLKNCVKPFIIVKKNNLKIGIFGLGTNLDNLTFSKNILGLKYKDTFITANEMAYKLKKELHCDLVICLSHIGFDGIVGQINDMNLASQSKDIDVIIGGHSHTYLETPQQVKNKEGKIVYISQTGAHGLNVGRLDLVLTPSK